MQLWLIAYTLGQKVSFFIFSNGTKETLINFHNSNPNIPIVKQACNFTRRSTLALEGYAVIEEEICRFLITQTTLIRESCVN